MSSAEEGRLLVDLNATVERYKTGGLSEGEISAVVFAVAIGLAVRADVSRSVVISCVSLAYDMIREAAK